MKRRRKSTDAQLPPSFQRFGDDLQRAVQAELDAAAQPGTRLRRMPARQLILIALLLVALLAAAVAGASSLIGIGKPTDNDNNRSLPPRFAPGGPRAIVLQTSDPVGNLPWAVAVSKSKSGQDCALAGRRHGNTIGLLNGKRFSPFTASAVGLCTHLDRTRLIFTVDYPKDIATRTLVYGRLRPTIRRLKITVAGETTTLTPTAGTFLLVYDGHIPSGQVTVAPVTP